MNRQQFAQAVAIKLGYEGHIPPHHVARQIESCFLRQLSVEEVVELLAVKDTNPL